MKRIAVAVVGIVLTLFVFRSASSRPKQVKRRTTATHKSLTLPEAIKQVSPSVVQITIHLDRFPAATEAELGKFFLTLSLGTGFLVNEDGYVITAKHVIDAVEGFKLRNRAGQELAVGRKRTGIGLPGPNTPNTRGTFSIFGYELIDVDPVHDLALLKIQRNGAISTYLGIVRIEGGHAPPIGRSFESLVAAKLSPNRPQEGEPIAVSGYPLSANVMITTSGTVASPWSYEVSEVHPPGTPDWFRLPDIADSYLADMRVNGGNSGGPVYSVASGAVIGVCVGFGATEVRYGDSSKEPVTIQGRPLVYNSGVSVVVPIQYVIEILRKKNLKWSESDRR